MEEAVIGLIFFVTKNSILDDINFLFFLIFYFSMQIPIPPDACACVGWCRQDRLLAPFCPACSMRPRVHAIYRCRESVCRGRLSRGLRWE